MIKTLFTINKWMYKDYSQLCIICSCLRDDRMNYQVKQIVKYRTEYKDQRMN